MRFQRVWQCAHISRIVASLLTSASNGTHSAPGASLAAICAVSAADATSRSTHSTLAPSWAKRITVARPFPMPVPGPCPAPTTIATLSLRRMLAPSLRQLSQ
jgi:hypothetical protein